MSEKHEHEHCHEHHHDHEEHCCGQERHAHEHNHEHEEHCCCGHEYHEHEHEHNHEHHHRHEHVHETPEPETKTAKHRYTLENLGCANCATKMERKISELPGVEFAAITFTTKQLCIATDSSEDLLPKIQEICASIESEVIVTPLQ